LAQLNEREVTARCDPTALLDLVEEALDEIVIEISAEADWFAAVAFRRDVGRRSLLMASSLIQSAS
jgi:hypothetical protein